MKIAFDYQTFCNQKYGGISRYFVSLAKELVRLEQNARIFAPIHQNVYVQDLKRGLISGVGVPRYPPKSWSLLSSINRVIAKRAIKNWNADIVHETFYSPYKSGSNKMCTVITVYDMIHELFKESFPVNDRTTEIKKIAIKRADHVICISNNTRIDLINLLGISEKKVSYVHLGFDKLNSSSLDSLIVKKIERPFLLYVSSRNGYKNFTSFLKSIAQSKKLTDNFDIVAFGGGRFTPSELELIKRLGFRKGQVSQVTGSDTLLQSYYIQAHAFVYPSLYEGFGLPPIEAMAYGCPVISSNSSSMPEILGGAAEFFNPNEVDEMSCAIENVVFSEERINQLKDLGLIQYKKYSWSRCAEETISTYKKLL